MNQQSVVGAHTPVVIRLLPVSESGPNFNRRPKTDCFCWRCQKDLKPDQPRRWIHLVDGGSQFLHPESEVVYVTDGGDCGWFPVGMDCAKRIGLEWTTEIQ
jgi:hypothetical protein